MANVLVSGLINLETTLQVEAFPIQYTPVRFPFFGVRSTVSGVGVNLAKALSTLGDRVALLSLTGRDEAGKLVAGALQAERISDRYVFPTLAETAQSVILYDSQGRRQINTDLKDIQEQPYPQEEFEQALSGCDLAVLCNINFSRPFLAQARRAGKPVATDVHTIHSLEDGYNRDFMAAANILFMSDECLPEPPEQWIKAVFNRFGNDVIVIGLGARGALLHMKEGDGTHWQPAVETRPVVNTIGAGDALFACFLHYYMRDSDPVAALQKATLFASYKIGKRGAAEGFLSEEELQRLEEDFREGHS